MPMSRQEIRQLQRATGLGEADAQHRLGQCYSEGDGVQQDHVEAVRLFRLAAAQGDAPAQHSLAVLCLDGLGVPQDHGEAIRMFRLAAEQGYPPAQMSLGICYGEGQGVLKDYGESAHWFRLAAEQGWALAQDTLANRASRLRNAASRSGTVGGRVRTLAKRLGFTASPPNRGSRSPSTVALYNAHGEPLAGYFDHSLIWISIDPAAATMPPSRQQISQLQRFAGRGEAEAQYRLALCYLEGDGVAQNQAEAVRMLLLGAA
jgi:TPR repeat protein